MEFKLVRLRFTEDLYAQNSSPSAVDGMPALKDASLWTVLENGIYFVPAAAPHSIYYFDFSSEKVRPLIDIDRDFNTINGGLAVSPDGRSILYSQIDDISSNVILVSNFR